MLWGGTPEKGATSRATPLETKTKERSHVMTKQFDELLLKQVPKLRAYAMTLTRNGPDADDLVQATAERVLKYQSQFQTGTNFAAWSSRILKNGYISNCRKNRRPMISLSQSPTLDQTSEYHVPVAALISPARQEDQVFAKEVISGLDRLSAPLRQILTLACKELTYEEVSVAMKCTMGTVKSRLWRAREQMKSFALSPDQQQIAA